MAGQAGKPLRLVGGNDLRIADAGTLQPLIDRLEALAVAVMGMDLPAIVHGSRHGQCLTATAGAEIHDLHLGLRSDQQGRNLRSRILDLEPAALKAGFGLDIGCPLIAARRGKPDRQRRQRTGNGGELGQRLEALVPRRLERIGPEIDRRALGQRCPSIGARSPKARSNDATSHCGMSPATWTGSSGLSALAASRPASSAERAPGPCSSSIAAAKPASPIGQVSLAAARIRARGVSLPMRWLSELRRRSASNTRLPMAERSPEPAKRWSRAQSFSARDAG